MSNILKIDGKVKDGLLKAFQKGWFWRNCVKCVMNDHDVHNMIYILYLFYLAQYI